MSPSMEERMPGFAESTPTRNVARLLHAAEQHGRKVEPSEVVAGCWTIRHDDTKTWGDPSLTIYNSGMTGAHVLYDPGSGSAWLPVTQSRALLLIIEGI